MLKLSALFKIWEKFIQKLNEWDLIFNKMLSRINQKHELYRTGDLVSLKNGCYVRKSWVDIFSYY